MTARVPLLWKALLGLIVAGLLGCVASWFVLLTTICSNPRHPDIATGHTNPYNCHGMTVFLTPLSQTLLHWLVPAGSVLMVLAFGVLAAILVRAAKVTVTRSYGDGSTGGGSSGAGGAPGSAGPPIIS